MHYASCLFSASWLLVLLFNLGILIYTQIFRKINCFRNRNLKICRITFRHLNSDLLFVPVYSLMFAKPVTISINAVSVTLVITCYINMKRKSLNVWLKIVAQMLSIHNAFSHSSDGAEDRRAVTFTTQSRDIHIVRCGLLRSRWDSITWRRLSNVIQ